MALAPITPQTLQDTGRTATTPLAGTELAVVWQAGKLVAVPVSEIGGSLPTRQQATITTASLAPLGIATGALDLAKGYRLLAIDTSAPCRVRIYTTAAKRDADLLRQAGTPQAQGAGLMLEFISTTLLLGADLSPTVDGFNAAGQAFYSVQNLTSSAAVVVVDFDYLETEI